MKINTMLLLFPLLFCGFLSHAQKQDTPTMTVGGLTQKTLVLTADSLRKRSVQEGKNIRIASPKGQIMGTIATFRGVKIKDLLEEAQLVIPEYADRGLYYIKAIAQDGSRLIFSWHEIFSGPAGDKTFLVFESTGSFLQESGVISLVCSSDIFTECRYIKRLKSLEVLRAF